MTYLVLLLGVDHWLSIWLLEERCWRLSMRMLNILVLMVPTMRGRAVRLIHFVIEWGTPLPFRWLVDQWYYKHTCTRWGTQVRKWTSFAAKRNTVSTSVETGNCLLDEGQTRNPPWNEFFVNINLDPSTFITLSNQFLLFMMSEIHMAADIWIVAFCIKIECIFIGRSPCKSCNVLQPIIINLNCILTFFLFPVKFTFM